MRRRTIALLCVWTLPSVVLLAATAIGYHAFRIPPPDRLDATERAAVIAVLRAGLADGAPQIATPAVRRPLGGPLAVTAWYGGRALVRVTANGDDVSAAAVGAARQLHDQPALQSLSPSERAGVRLQVDLVTGTGPLGGHSGWYDSIAVPGIGDMLAINPGVEGVAAELDGKQVLLLPHELVAARLLAARRPSSVFPDFAMGVDVDSIAQLLAARAGAPSGTEVRGLVRFRTDTFVEAPYHAGHAAPPLALYRGIPPAPRLSGQALREAALRGGRYLVAHLAPNGRYVYEHDLSTGTASDASRIGGSYSMPRHAGTTYFLAELYRITREPWLLEPIQRAFAHLADLLAQGTCTGTLPDGTAFDCVIDRNESVAHLGSTALTVVALAEYQRATGDARYLPTAKKLAAWILWMQREDGSFRHLYDPSTRQRDDESQLLYYSGEASLALARMFAVTGDRRYAVAAEKGLDWLVGWYDFFMGGFFYGEEHWTCIAAEAAYPAVNKAEHVDFCHGYGAFLRQQQAERGDFPDEDDWTGAYAFTPFLVPYNTPAGSRTEAMISAYLLGRHHGTPDPQVRAQIRAALQYALGQQIRPDTDFAVIGPGLGGMPGSPIDRNIRIDYVQHVCSAMIRASEWIDDAAP
jgi:hypothetical protein